MKGFELSAVVCKDSCCRQLNGRVQAPGIGMEWKGSGCWRRRNGFWLTARELNDSGCQHGNEGFLDAYMAREGFWLHAREVSGSDCLDEKGEILAAYTEREGLWLCTRREGFWLDAREGRDSDCRHGKRDFGCMRGRGGI